MATLKDLFLEFEDDKAAETDDGSVEVFADSVNEALELAAADMGLDVSQLDYEVIEKGTKGIFGIGRQPYRVIVTPLASAQDETDIEELELKLGGSHLPGINLSDKKESDGDFKIRVTKTGIWLKVEAPKGKGARVSPEMVENKCIEMRLGNYNKNDVAKAVKKAGGKPVKIGDWQPNPVYDGSMRVEVSEDEMKAFVYFNPPKYSGRHMDYEDVVDALRNAGVATGIKEKDINDYLEEMEYRRPLLAAEGIYPRNGNDASVEYKVRVDKSNTKFEEDESGKVDFRNLELLENVVVGQLLAVKIPAEEGIPGRTITNRVLPAKSGKDNAIKFGKGTILSEDGTELTAEINGQVVFKVGKISVEPVFIVNGDVGLESGNIVFLGSVIVQGSVQDNFEVKAAGNVEVKGTVQKAFIEAEGDIIVHQGISGKDEAKVESTGGSVFAKFAQNANIIAEKSVVIPEGILHSRVDAGEKVYSVGRRAKIAGGVIRAGDEINARFLGAESSPKTVLRVGVNPKILQQMDELLKVKTELETELTKLRLDIKTLTTQKRNSGGKLSDEREKMLSDYTAREEKQNERFQEISSEYEELNSYISMLDHKGKICAEKTVYPNVDVLIKDDVFPVKDNYNRVKFMLQGGSIQIFEYDPPVFIEGSQRIMTVIRRR